MRRLMNLLPWRRRRLERELGRELRDHVERRAEELARAGVRGEAARRRALLEFGSFDEVQEEVREAWVGRWADGIVSDVRYAGRALLRSPGFAAAAVVSVALGVGANAAIVSLVDQAFLRGLPGVRTPGDLVQLGWDGNALSSEWGGGRLLSYALCRELDGGGGPFDGVFCRHPTSVNVSTGGAHAATRADLVSGSFFPVLGVRPAQGRLIDRTDDVRPGAHPVVVVSHDFWRSELGSRPDAAGLSILVNNQPMTVIGVAPADFAGVDPIDAPSLWLPAAMTAQASPELGARVLDPRTAWMHVFARLQPAVTARQAEARVQPWFRRRLDVEAGLEGFPSVGAEDRASFLASRLELLSGARGVSARRGEVERPLALLLAGTTLLLLLACLNVAGLVLARGAARAREFSTRAALGASRGRITRQVMAETGVLGLLGTAVGLAAAPAAFRLLVTFLLPEAALAFRFDPHIVAYASVACLVTVAACGLVPALQLGRRSVMAALGDRSRGASGGAVRVRKAIVVAQLAFTLVLLIGAGLFVQTLAGLLAKDRGFESEGLLMFSMNPPALGYPDSAAAFLLRDLLARLRASPDIEAAAVANTSLLMGGSFRRMLTIDARDRVVTERTVPGLRSSPGFFATLGTRVVAGREFDESDVPRPGETRYRSAIVNRSFAQRYFGSAVAAVGKRIGIGDQPDTPVDIEIVGVVEDFSYRYLRDAEPEHVFLPFGHPGPLSADGTFFVRARGEPAAAFATVRAAVAELNPALPVGSLTTLDAQVGRTLRNERMLATLSSGFGAIALLLAVVGLYGVVSFVVTRRRREIGVRVALGATRGAAVWLITRDALVTIGVGIGLALPFTWALGRLVESQLYGVRAFDVPTIALASAALALVAIGAALRPAWRAASISPTEALRFE
jgi:predicted permease